jgi:hypothetical protein
MVLPSTYPSVKPTNQPSSEPSSSPSKYPSSQPSSQPTTPRSTSPSHTINQNIDTINLSNHVPSSPGGTNNIQKNVDSKTIFSASGVFSGSITLKEGSVITTRYSVVTADPDQRFLIPNATVDTTTLVVTVLNSAVDSTTRTFTLSENLVEIDSTSLVYFLQESEDGQYEIKFGEGTFGVALDNGNIVVIRYLVSNGALANDINALTYSDSVAGVLTATFTATDPAVGGANRETPAQIKFNAPKSYEAQNRVVTAEDYKSLLLSQPTVNSVVVWGGEDNDPPTFGKVFIAIKPTTGDVLTATEKINLIQES